MKKVVLSYLGGLGDTFIMIPTLRAIKKQYPQVKTIVIVTPAAKDLFEDGPYVDDVIYYRKGDNIFPVIRKIWRADLALLFDNTSQTRQLVWAARVRQRLGFGIKRKRFLTMYKEKMDRSDIYQAECYLDLARLVGIDTADKSLYIAPCRESEKQAVDLLLAKVIYSNQDKYIAIAPYSSDYFKDWPEENYNTLIRYFTKLGYATILIGGKELEQKKECFPEAVYFPNMNPRQSTYIISLAEMIFCGCTFALHLASTTDTPIVALYGKSSADRWAPYKNCTVIKADVSCRDSRKQTMNLCTSSECKWDRLCMRRITPQKVIDVAMSILK